MLSSVNGQDIHSNYQGMKITIIIHVMHPDLTIKRPLPRKADINFVLVTWFSSTSPATSIRCFTPAMPPSEFPKYPTPPSIRLANAGDIARMADLSVLGFRDSEIFRYERPEYKTYPHDAVKSFANICRRQLSDPLAVVIVAEDWRVPDELSHFPQRTDPPAAERVVVGVASWNLPEGSRRAGQFVVPDVGYLEPCPDRDLCQRRLELFTRITEAEEKR